jgi:hypothetical protein
MTLQHLRSSTQNKRPQPSGMAVGQLAMNTASGSTALFFKDVGEALVKVGPVHVGSGAPNITPASGGSSGNSIGEQWLDTSGGITVLKTWDGSAWDLPMQTRVSAAGVASGTLTVNAATTDLFTATGLTGTVTFAAPSGTAVDGQKLLIRLKDDGTARTVNWTTSSGGYRAIGVTLPSGTTANKITYLGCLYNSSEVFWDVVATVTQA